MRSRRIVLCSVALLTVALGLAAPPLLSRASAALMVRGPVFIWDQGAATDAWDDEVNWLGDSGYPSSTAHGVEFDDNSGTAWTVDVTAETIGQLYIEENVHFTGQSGTPTLTVDTLIIDATAAAVTVTFNDELEFNANEWP